jgi:hypothetical protein
MATSRICSIPDCGKRHKALGWCQIHYSRFKAHGDPLGGINRPAHAQLIEEIDRAIAGAKRGPCWHWPYTRNRDGYGRVVINKKGRGVHRVVCERVHGPPPSLIHEAAHSCGSGHLGCINWHHLRWATPLENSQDRINHGRSCRGDLSPVVVLNAGLIQEIRREYVEDSARQVKLALKYGVAQTTISAIVRRKIWSWLQ